MRAHHCQDFVSAKAASLRLAGILNGIDDCLDLRQNEQKPGNASGFDFGKVRNAVQPRFTWRSKYRSSDVAKSRNPMFHNRNHEQCQRVHGRNAFPTSSQQIRTPSMINIPSHTRSFFLSIPCAYGHQSIPAALAGPNPTDPREVAEVGPRPELGGLPEETA